MNSESTRIKQVEDKLAEKGYVHSGKPYSSKSPYSTISLENKSDYYKPPVPQSAYKIGVVDATPVESTLPNEASQAHEDFEREMNRKKFYKQ